MIYLIIYFLIYLNSIFAGNANKLIFFVLFLFSGLRYKTGLDYENYDEYFNNLPNNIWDFEFGFHILSLTSKYLGIYHYIFFSLIIFIIIYLAVKNRSSIETSFFLIIFTYYGLWNIFSVLRQSIACALFFFVVLNYNKLKLKTKIILYLVAISMHYSAIFFIVVIEFIIPFIINKSRLQVILIIISILLIQFKIDSSYFIPSPWKYALEITSLVKEVKFSLKFLEMVLIFLVSRFFLRSKFDLKLISFLSIQIFFYSLFSSISFLSERLNVYFDLIYAVLFARIILFFIMKFKEKFLLLPLFATFLIVFIGFRYYQYLFKADYSEIPDWEITNKDRFIPYQSIINKKNERKY